MDNGDIYQDAMCEQLGLYAGVWAVPLNTIRLPTLGVLGACDGRTHTGESWDGDLRSCYRESYLHIPIPTSVLHNVREAIGQEMGREANCDHNQGQRNTAA